MFKGFICFSAESSIFLLRFSKTFLSLYFLSEGNISLHVRCLCLSVLPDDNADIFASSLLISYYSFSSLILSSIVMIIPFIFSETLSLKRKGLIDGRVISFTKKRYGFVGYFFEKFIKSSKSTSDQCRFVEAFVHLVDLK